MFVQAGMIKFQKEASLKTEDKTDGSSHGLAPNLRRKRSIEVKKFSSRQYHSLRVQDHKKYYV